MKMAIKNKKFTKPFSAALDRYIRMTGTTNDEVGIAVGYKSGGKAIDQIRNERSDGREKYRRAIAKHFGFKYQDFINLGKKIIASQENVKPSLPSMELDIAAVSAQTNITTERHRQTIDKFQDKELALEINAELVELEKLDKGQLKEILGIIKDRKFRLEQEALKKRTTANGE